MKISKEINSGLNKNLKTKLTMQTLLQDFAKAQNRQQQNKQNN